MMDEEEREKFRRSEMAYKYQEKVCKYLGKWLDNGKDVYMGLYDYYLDLMEMQV